MLAVLVLIVAVLLAATLVIVRGVARASGFCHADEVAAVFCGSQKSLVAGIPIASVMFPSPILGAVVLPIMIYHPLQLVVGAWLARRYANHLAAEQPRGHCASGPSRGGISTPRSISEPDAELN